MTTMFTPEHQWIDVAEEHQAAVVGITGHAQESLGDIVYVELPAVGAKFKKGDTAGTVESVKTAADVYMPVGGEIVEVNERLRSEPSLVNSEPLGEGWMFKVRIDDEGDLDSLLESPEYDALVKSA